MWLCNRGLIFNTEYVRSVRKDAGLTITLRWANVKDSYAELHFESEIEKDMYFDELFNTLQQEDQRKGIPSHANLHPQS